MIAAMKRRAFITLLGGAAAWPLAARAQQPERMRRIGVLIGSDDNTEARALFAGFQQALEQLGWIYGQTSKTTIAWEADPNAISPNRKDSLRLNPTSSLPV